MNSADRLTRTVTLLAWGLGAIFFSLAALPLAFSSPYPTPSKQNWTVDRAPVPMELASASSFSLASASSSPAPAPAASQSVSLVNSVRTVSFRRPDAAEPGSAAAPEPRIVTASLGAPPVVRARLPAVSADDEGAVPEQAPAKRAPPARQDGATMNDIDEYLWEVYQRAPTKRDSSGDFTWKDPAAAKRLGKTLQAYVIQGMDADLREQLYHAGKAMDAAGIEWTIVSGFRDDWRQSIAAGIKARTGYSRHGGSKATGGYGHGRAVDVGHADGKSHMTVFRWIDANGAKYGISRPIRHFDPPHVEPRVDWRRIAARLRRERTGVAVAEAPAEETRPTTARARVARSQSRSARGRRVN